MPNDIPNPTQIAADAFYAKPADSAPPADPPADPVPAPAEPAEGHVEPPADPVDPELSADGETPPADGEKPTDDGDGSIELQTFEQLAEHLEADPEYLQSLTITQKVNGETRQVKLADALQTHRKVEAADSYLSEAKSKAKALVAEAREQRESLGESVAALSALLQNTEQQLDADVGRTNWEQLRVDDPAEYTARRQDFEDRRKALDARKVEAVTEYRNALLKIQNAEEQAQLAKLPEERKRLLDLVPDWADDKKASAERSEVLKYLKEQGFNEDQIKIADYNAPVLALAIKARRYDAAKGKVDATKKRVITIPKVLKPGTKTEGQSKPKVDTSDRAKTFYG